MGFGKDGKGVIIREQRSQALTTLNNATALLIGTKLVTTEDFRMLKAEIQCFVTGLTAGEGTGLMLGLADGDLSTGEIAGVIQAQGPLDPNDIVQTDVAMRPVWLLGALDVDVNELTAAFRGEGNSPMIEAKPRWTFSNQGKAWNWFIWNNSGGNLTTGALASILAKSFGVWVR